MKHVALFSLMVFVAVAAAAVAAPTNESTRTGAAYFIGRAGTSWSYAADKGKARVTVDAVENLAARFHVDWGKPSPSGTWRARDGAWVEKLPGHEASVVLPAHVSVGSRWNGPAS